jgi:hypothetical protein
MSPTAEPLGRHSLDQTFVWILADDKERQSLPRTPAQGHTTVGDRTFRVAVGGFAERQLSPLIRIGSVSTG